jgi:hypothetical protein
MSNKALTWAFDQDLKAGPKFVLVALGDLADSEGSCFPGIKTIAKMVGTGDTAVKSNLAILKELGFVVEERRHRRNGSRTSNRYWLMMRGTVSLEPESDGYLQGSESGDLKPDSDEPRAGIRGATYPSGEPTEEPSAISRARKPRKNEPSEEFLAWYASYPKRIAKADAWKAWQQVREQLPDLAELHAATRRYARHVEGEDPKFTQSPAAWLRAGRWEDDPASLRGAQDVSHAKPKSAYPEGREPREPWTAEDIEAYRQKRIAEGTYPTVFTQ